MDQDSDNHRKTCLGSHPLQAFHEGEESATRISRTGRCPPVKNKKQADGAIQVGTSGWHYPHWKGPFFPGDLVKKRWLPYYAEHFQCVEINNSFYRTPNSSTIEDWRDGVPEGFFFTVKAPRTITHLKKLRNCAESVSLFLDRIQHFAPKLGPILFQLPPRWHCNPQRLEEFLTLLPDDQRFAFEFRDLTWHCQEVYELLAEKGAAFCVYDLETFTSPLEATTDFVYVRLHGPGERAYTGSYKHPTLRTWAGRAKRWARREKRDVYIFFDNDQFGHAVKNAMRFLSQVRED